MPICKFCAEERPLCKSHIVPEFLYKSLYNSKHEMMGIGPAHKSGHRLVRSGVYERLLCSDCEHYFSINFEQPFKLTWVDNYPYPKVWNEKEIYCAQFDYVSFKLFHLSVLWRAAVSSRLDFAEVNLGPHEERIREMLRHRIAGPAHHYPIVGFAVVHHKTKRTVPVMLRSDAIRIDACQGFRMIGIMFGGVQWHYGVSSHRCKYIEYAALRADGVLPLSAYDWNELPGMQAAAEYLRRAG